MEPSDRKCKVCGYPKRSYSNGCSNELCRFNEPEIISDEDALQIKESINNFQKRYIISLFMSGEKYSSINDLSIIMQNLKVLIFSPFLEVENGTFINQNIEKALETIIKKIIDDTTNSISTSELIKLDNDTKKIVRVPEVSINRDKIDDNLNKTIDIINTNINNLNTFLNDNKDVISSKALLIINEGVNFLIGITDDIRFLTSQELFSIIEVGLKINAIIKVGDEFKLKTNTIKIKSQLNKQVTMFKSKDGNDILFARNEKSENFNIEFYLINQLNKKTTISWNLKNYLSEKKSFQKFGFSFSDGKIFLHQLIEDKEYKYYVEVKNLVFL